MKVKFKKLVADAQVPFKKSPDDAGYDIYSTVDVEIYPEEVAKIPTGLAVELPEGTYGAIHARSGLAIKSGIVIQNQTGIIDKNYRGEVVVALRNISNDKFVVHKGDRIAQFIISPYLNADWVEVEELSETERGTGGFGSTGVK